MHRIRNADSIEMMYPIRSFPAISQHNKYQDNFYAPLQRAGFEISDWSWSDLVKSKQILHIHWPEAWSWCKVKRLKILRLLYFFSIPARKALLDLTVVNTVHNLRPHEVTGGWKMRIYRWVLGQSDAFIHLTEAGKRLFQEAYPELKNKRHFIIPHPSYEPQLSEVDKSFARQQLQINHKTRLFVYTGLIRPYKGLERLVASFKKHALPNDLLLISGSGEESYCRAVEELCYAAQNIRFTYEFISESEMELRVKAADWVVLPFHAGLNSGTAIYAISCGTKIFAPDTPVFREVNEMAGGSAFHFFRDDFDWSFRDLLSNVPITSLPVRSTSFSEAHVGALSVTLFSSLSGSSIETPLASDG